MNKIAMVTGASRGIGRATALAFAREGYDLVISARSVADGTRHEHQVVAPDGTPLAGSLQATAAAVEALGRKVWMIPLDLLDEASVGRAVEEVTTACGRVDVLVNNAIYQGADLNHTFLDLSVDTLDRVWRGYVQGPVALTQGIARLMVAQGAGVVVNVTSGAGERNPPVAADKGGWGYAYGAGKAAVSRLAGILNVELGHRGLRAYTINPGVVSTEALQATIGARGVAALGGVAAPPEVPAEAIVWLARADHAGRYTKDTVQAQTLALDHYLVSDWRK
ncbi:SDR family NAD(P)-dependent oxidoreductase [Marinobacter sp. X15-166B]|uniref:SDR family NAD(P)-dependent oxidoreductase n=1 Tax=Marinobacter sp. X15-166B TaxID=1897620 RepID=UPI00085C313C|nr:SDR family oxidoreductase [Marinobacter sp. X15-166B]OEY66345.1 short-chain dehydrogenase [Marinobacter sp. X15-166B]